jgi:glucose/arabinose dehydrogenase
MSYGYRNPQGLVMVNGVFYESEHGPDIEDEVNIIEKGRNYGWPDVKGPCNRNDEITFANHMMKEPIWRGGGTIAVCGLIIITITEFSMEKFLLMMTLRTAARASSN